MDIKLMNFCRIRDPKKKKILVLDKIKKVGWEGLTFPGGKVKVGESSYDACVREVKEETGLDVHLLKYCGFLEWVFEGESHRELVMMYDAVSFSGEILGSTHEGSVFWMDEDEFFKAEGKADYFNTYFRVIDDDSVSEAFCYYGKNGNVTIRYYPKQE